MTVYPRMDESADLNDMNYSLAPYTPSPSVDRFGNSVAPGNHTFDNTFPFNPSFDTIEPSSLELYRTSHDDSCLDKCLDTYSPQGLHRNTVAQPFPPRSRPSTSSFPTPYHMPENNAFHTSTHQPLTHMYPDPFPDLGFKYGSHQDTRANHHCSNNEPQIGNYFNAADLGFLSQRPVPDDCASVNCSKYSCSSDCCSTQVCQEEACSGEGTPCDDLHCLDSATQPFEQVWAMNQGWHEPVQQNANPELHDQPCNHTNTEHDVAITLRDLSAPGAATVQQQQQQQQQQQYQQQQHGFPQFDCHLLSPADQPVDSARALSVPDYSQSSLSCTPDLDSVPPPLDGYLLEPPAEGKHVCKWILSAGGPGAQVKVCGTVCDDACSFQDHVCNEHISLLSSKTKYLCSWKGCSRRDDQVFASRNKLRRHIATHTEYKPHKCEICGEGFSAQQALDQHVRTHTGEMPYQCDIEGCFKKFKQKSALTMHKRTHTGEKPLVCNICGKKFGESSNLSKHRKTHNPVLSFECDEPGCKKRFKRNDQLKRHQETHRPGKKPGARARGPEGAGAPTLSPMSPETPQDSLLTDSEPQTQD
ncbi:hypothetical protein F4677DRAFT_17426 [Hypoxylon crocopeplum]|nr:hypothetical protein F4677DRAFT_17426 [Hypoxylon crocopeplum]